MRWTAMALGAVSVVALATALWAWWGDRARGRRRCPRCWYDMAGVTGLTCPECGRVARAEKALGRTRRRWKTGALAPLVGVGALVTIGVREVPLYEWMRVAPTAAVALLAEFKQCRNVAKNELWHRVSAGDSTFLLPRRDLHSRWVWRLIASANAAPEAGALHAIATWALASPHPRASISPDALVDALCDQPPHRCEALYASLDLAAVDCLSTVHRDTVRSQSIVTSGPLGEVRALKTEWAMTLSGEVWIFSRPVGGEWRLLDRVVCLGRQMNGAPTPELHASPDGRVFVVVRAGGGGGGVTIERNETWYEVEAGGVREVLNHLAESRILWDSSFPESGHDSKITRIDLEAGATFLEFSSRSAIYYVDRPEKPLWVREGTMRYAWSARTNQFELDEPRSTWSGRDITTRYQTPDTDFCERLLFEDIAAGLRTGDVSERERIQKMAQSFRGRWLGPEIQEMLDAAPPLAPPKP